MDHRDRHGEGCFVYLIELGQGVQSEAHCRRVPSAGRKGPDDSRFLGRGHSWALAQGGVYQTDGDTRGDDSGAVSGVWLVAGIRRYADRVRPRLQLGGALWKLDTKWRLSLLHHTRVVDPNFVR
jgi:hypothetical protein